MEILKSKEERGHEVNRYASHIGNPVVRDLDKIVREGKAYKRAADALDFSKWEDSDGSTFETYNKLLDYQADKFMNKYPAVFAKEVKPELLKVEGREIVWNREAVRISFALQDQWRAFVMKMDLVILFWDGYDIEAETDIDKRDIALDAAFERLAQLKIDNERKNIENNLPS